MDPATNSDRPLRRRAWVQSTGLQDAALSVAVTTTEVFYFGVPLLPGRSPRDQLLLALFAAAEAVALALRRRRPLAVFAVLWATAVTADLLTLTTDLLFAPYFGLLLALYTLAERSRWPLATAALLLTLVPAGLDTWFTVSQLADPDHHTAVLIADLAFYLPLTAAAWGLARWQRAGRAAAERGRCELAEAREAVARERRQIARELHDIVANAVAVMVMRAETARSAEPPPAPPTGEALRHIEDLGRDAMTELRRMLRLLRSADTPVEPSRHGLGDLEALLTDARRAGLQVALEVRGTAVRIDDSVDLTAYRLVHEAVTNITKHAGPGTTATVRLSWGDTLLIEVIDDGRGRASTLSRDLSTGHGLIGLAERISLFGGRLTAAPHGTGFRVAAVLPVSGQPG